jgi:hypothetical protein
MTLIHSDRLLLAAAPDWAVLLPLPGVPPSPGVTWLVGRFAITLSTEIALLATAEIV